MNLMVTDLYDALISAGADEAKARKAVDGLSANAWSIEPRVARLEASVAHIEYDIQEVKTDIRELRVDMGGVKERLARLEEKVSHLPGKGFIVTSLLLTLAVLAGLITFQDRVQGWIANSPANMLQIQP